MNARFTASLAFLGVFLSSGHARADAWKFCMNWVISSTDSGAGEDHHTNTTTMKARGVKVSVDHANWAQPKSFFADEHQGCFVFNATENTGFRVEMWAESRIGVNGNISIKAFNSKANRIANNVQSWVIFTNPGGIGRTISLQNTSSSLSNLIAWPTFVVYWIDHFMQPRLTGAQQLLVSQEDCELGGSCQDREEVFIQTDNGYLKKFLIGHEVGHWLQEARGGRGTHNYGLPSNVAACAYTGVGDHALRSKEWSAGAFQEGFAHFLSTLAFNDHTQLTAFFRYYKDISGFFHPNSAAYADLAEEAWIVNVEGGSVGNGGGPSNWLSIMGCTVTDGTSVEMDWQRFYWDYLTDTDTPKPDQNDIFDHLAYTQANDPWLNDNVYDELVESMSDMALGQTNLASRWKSRAISNGVAQ